MASVTANYGSRLVLQDFDLRVEPGELVAILGHNGAGKTTALRVAAGLKRPESGSVHMGGDDLGRLSTHERARLGLGFVPKGVSGLFSTLTVQHNMDAVVPCEGTPDSDTWRKLNAHLRDVFPEVLVDRAHQVAGSMSGGQRQMLAIAMALVRRPTALLLDEPSTGLAPIVVGRILEVVRHLVDATGTCVVLVEQNLANALKVADRAIIVRSGSIEAEFTKGSFPEPTELWRYF